jgi:hypothetical protein
MTTQEMVSGLTARQANSLRCKRISRMRHSRSADSGKFLEWLPTPYQPASCSRHKFGGNPEDLLHWEFPGAKLWREIISS